MIVAMVSGGVDSVVLLDVLVARGEDVVVLHVDHGLRVDSGRDARFVRTLHADVRVVELRGFNGNGSGEGGGVQAWARCARYRAALQLASELGPDACVATGHTASDQVEGVLYRLAASPGRRALLGMSERSGRLVRPLLGWTRDDVLAYAGSRGLAWREDPSNASDAYARNRARHRLVPALRELHPAAEANVLATLGVLRDEAAVLDDVVEAALGDCGFDGESVSRERLRALRPALARLVLQRLADGASRQKGPTVGGRLPELLALRGGTKGVDLGGGLRGEVAYDRLSVRACCNTHPHGASCSTPLPVPGRTPFLTGVVSASRHTTAEGGWARVPDLLDAGGRPLTLRTRRAGDRMRPLNLGGSKSLQDLFTDRKVPRADRDAWPVVCACDEIVWVPHVATAESARITDATTTAVHLRWDRVRSAAA